MNFAENPERERILDQALNARTSSQIALATQELRGWVRQNPADIGIREAFEGLSLMQDIAEEQEAECRQTNREFAGTRGQ